MSKARDLADSADKDIAGTIVLDDITLSNDMSVADNGKVQFGASNDLQIFHTGADSVIHDSGAGNLDIRADSLSLLNAAGSEYYARFYTNGAANLYHNGSLKINTTSIGIDVTGSVTADGLTVDSGTISPITTLSRSGTHSGISFSQTISNITGGGSDLITYSTGNDTGFAWQTTDSGGTQTRALTIAPDRSATFSSSVAATSLDISGNIDVDGVTNLDVVDIDGAVDMASTLTVAGNLNLGDNVKAQFGSPSNDLQIYHDGSNSYINDTGTGALFLKTNYLAVAGANGNQLINAEQGGAIELYHSNAKKLETTSTGIDLTGNLHIVGGDGLNGSSTIGGSSNEFIIENNADAGMTIRSGADSDGVISFADPDDHNVGQVYYSHDTDKMSIVTNDAVQMTITSTGTVDVVNDVLANNAKLKALAKDISDTAVDVFVYDTRKDSDGGAWRKAYTTYKLVQRSTEHGYSWSKKRISKCCCDCCREWYRYYLRW